MLLSCPTGEVDPKAVASVSSSLDHRHGRPHGDKHRQVPQAGHLQIKERREMPHYMTQFSYTAEAVAAMIKKPQDRSVGLREAVEKLGVN